VKETRESGDSQRVTEAQDGDSADTSSLTVLAMESLTADQMVELAEEQIVTHGQLTYPLYLFIY